MAIYPHVLHTVVGNSGGRCSLLAKCTRQPCRSCPHCVQQGHEETAQVHAVIAFGHLHFHCWISAFVIWIATPKCNRPRHSILFFSIGANIYGRCFWLLLLEWSCRRVCILAKCTFRKKNDSCFCNFPNLEYTLL